MHTHTNPTIMSTVMSMNRLITAGDDDHQKHALMQITEGKKESHLCIFVRTS